MHKTSVYTPVNGNIKKNSHIENTSKTAK